MKRHFAPAAKAKAAKPDSTAGWWGRLCRCGKKPVKEEEKEPEEEFDSPEAALNAFDKKAARAVATAAATPSAVTPTAAAGGMLWHML